MKININEFTTDKPKEAGFYLWYSLVYSLVSFEIIRVVWYEPKDAYGVGYYGVPNYGNRNVTQLSGRFLKIEIGE